MLRWWEICRDPQGGWKHLPVAGGVADQPAWLMDAMDALEIAWLKHRPKPGKGI